MGLLYRYVHPFTSGILHIWRYGRVGCAGFTLDHVSRSQDLSPMAYGSNRFLRFGKVLNYLEDSAV